jgi:hypothetical protein
MSHRALLLALISLVAPVAAACSSSSNAGDGGSASTPCNQNPWECSAGQVCWPQTQANFACLNAGPGKLGDACMNTAGSPTCGAGLACFQSGATGGSCLSYCSTTDPSHACTGDAVCQTAALGGGGGPEFSICVPQPTGGNDGGAEASQQGDTGSPTEAGAGD